MKSIPILKFKSKILSEESSEDKPKEFSLFDFTKILFEKPNEYKKLKSFEKAKFFFMCQRFFSINYPLQTGMFNINGINSAAVLDYWQEQLSKQYNRTPSWMFIKTKKVVKDEKKIKYPSEEAISIYLKRLSMSRRDLDQAFEMFGEDVYGPIHLIDESKKANK